MTMITEFLAIAKMDLEASKVLYEKDLYPQAVFYFQQSVEKATKAFALITGQKISEKEFINDIGHHAINIFEKSIRDQKNRYEQLKANLNRLPELKETKIVKNFNLERNIRQLNRYLSNIKKIKKDKRDLIYISSWDIRRILKEIKEIESAKKEFEKVRSNISNLKISERASNKMKKELIELYSSLSKYDSIRVEEAKNDLEKIDLKQLAESSIKSFFEPIGFILFLSIALYYLAIVTLPHSSLTRYPQNDLTPVNLYTKKLPIVKKLPELCEVQDNVLNELKLFTKKLEE